MYPATIPCVPGVPCVAGTIPPCAPSKPQRTLVLFHLVYLVHLSVAGMRASPSVTQSAPVVTRAAGPEQDQARPGHWKANYIWQENIVALCRKTPDLDRMVSGVVSLQDSNILPTLNFGSSGPVLRYITHQPTIPVSHQTRLQESAASFNPSGHIFKVFRHSTLLDPSQASIF